MNIANGTGRFLLMVVLTLSCTLPAQAATPRDGGDQALRQAQYLLQKLSGEKAALEKENQRLAEELKKTQDELAGTHKKLASTQEQGAQVHAAFVARVQADNERIGNLQTTYHKEIGDARADIQLLRNAVQERDAWITDCRAKNEGLYKTNSELLQAYHDKGAWDALAQREPLTGVGSVKVENAIQEYQFRLEDLRTVKFEPSTALPEPQTAQRAPAE